MTITKNPPNSDFATSDLALAAAISLYYPIEAIDRLNHQKAEFVFRRDPEFDKLVEAFWRNELQVSPQSYFYQLKLIKTRLYEIK